MDSSGLAGNHSSSGAVHFTAQTAARRDKLAEASIVRLAEVPGGQAPINVSGRLTASAIESRRFIRIGAALKMAVDGVSPVLSTFTLRWNCE